MQVPSSQVEIRNQLLQKIYGVDVSKLSAISSAAVKKEWMDAHHGEEPSMEYVVQETMKRTRQPLGVMPSPERPSGSERVPLGGVPQQTKNGDEVESYISKSERRALLVAKVIDELTVLRTEPEFQLEEDFAPVRKKYKGKLFYTFNAARKFPNLKDSILTVKSKRGTPIGLAQQIVATCEGVRMGSIIKDWLHFKPQQYRQSFRRTKP